MSMRQQPRIAPPTPEDKTLTDYSGVLQRLFGQLFQAAHDHVGKNGTLTAFPSAKDGMPGDMLLAVVAGTAYVCFKVDKSNWYKLAATHV